jgi:DNA (cytosine-5)-methyltransferase 1
MSKWDDTLHAINLFCGAGGLTLGLKKAGFNVLAGVEVNPEIAKTYKANHPEIKLLIKDVRKVTGADIFELTGKEKIDLVAGCPPCQGFSQLTEKYKRYDLRNELILEMARLIEEIKPKMVMMENVPGIVTKGKSILNEFVKKLENFGYSINMDVLQMADYGIPQSRRRFVLLAGKGFKIALPQPTHCAVSNEKKNLKPWVTLARVIKDMPEPTTLKFALKNGGPEKYNWHVVRNLKEISIERLKVMNPGDNRLVLPMHLRPKCHEKDASGFKNVYGRMNWNQVSPTITSGCTTPCMGRFGHPDELRTISIREAALIQTFPRRYKFDTKFMDTACDLVGNALPCIFAQKVAETCLKSFREDYLGKMSSRPYVTSGSVFYAKI